MFKPDEDAEQDRREPTVSAAKRWPDTRSRWLAITPRIAAALGALVAIFGLAAILLTSLLDAGKLDRPVEAWVSQRSGRPVRFGALRAHLLSRAPGFELDDVTVSNPPGFPQSDLATVQRVTGGLRLSSLWHGSIGLKSLRLDGVSLSLIRFGPDRNNWTPAHHRRGGPAFAALAGVEDFQVSRGHLHFLDHARDLDVSGAFSVIPGPRAFHFSGAGSYAGAQILASMAGGALHGAAVRHAYPFAGRLIDGHTRVDVRGASVQPFDLSAYRLAAAAAGPNLADLGYLFHLVTPNTPPFRLTALIDSGGGIMRIGRIDIRTGTSHLTGKIWSNHSDPRRDIRARLHAIRLDRADISAMLAPVPPRGIARDRPGATPPSPPGRFIISAAPLDLARLRATDLDVDVSVGSLTGYALPLHDIVTRADLDHGLLALPAFTAKLFGGTLVGRGAIDGRPAVPHVLLALRASGLRLEQIGTGASAKGLLDGQISLSGSGASFHAAAAGARGTASLRIALASAPGAAGWMVGGDLLRAAATAMGPTRAGTAMIVSAPRFAGERGHLVSPALTAASAAGSAAGNAAIDFRTETLCGYLIGHPAKRRLFQVAAPLRVSGKWLAPRVTVLPSAKAHALGLRGKAGVLLTPLAGLLPIRAREPLQMACQ